MKDDGDMENWVTSLFGHQAMTDMFDYYTNKELFDVIESGEKYSVKVVMSQGELSIDLSDRITGESMNRMFPVGGFTPEQRSDIAKQALSYVEDGMPIMWKEIISPMIQGYWDEEWDVIKVHDIDRTNVKEPYKKLIG